MPTTDFQALIAGARKGDERSIAALVRILRGDLERFAQRYADPASASQSTSDLVQEAWVRAWQNLGEFRGAATVVEEERVFRAWIRQIVHRIGLNSLRDRRTARRQPAVGRILRIGARSERSAKGPIEIAGRGPTPSARTREDEEAAHVRRALESIEDETSRRIVRLRFFEGLPLREIADELSLSFDQVRDRYRKNLRLLERRLSNLQ